MKICLYCKKEFGKKNKEESNSHFERKRFCSQHCAGMTNRANIIARNKERRKYPIISGLSRQQVHYRYNPDSLIFHRDEAKREIVIKYLGGKCIECGYDKNIRGLVLDHKNGTGKEDRKRLGSKISRYYCNNLEESKENLQVLCATCNQIKAIEKKEHNKSRRIITFKK